jgi:SAM-dependent methyltransferase
MMPAALFDPVAPDYDAHFTDSTLGRLLRRAAWRWLDRAFAPGDRVLELNCGTGEDAVHLAGRGVRVLATDASPAMLAVAQAKLERAGLTDTVAVKRVELEHLARELGPSEPLDGAFSNFGGLNCVADLGGVARALAALLKPGARVVLCVMGPLVPWEWAWFVAHGQPAKAVRRLAPSGAAWRGATVHYPSPRALRRTFAPEFALRRLGPLGVLLPPTYAESWARRHPALLARLDRWERRLETWSSLAWLGDHYLVELERV